MISNWLQLKIERMKTPWLLLIKNVYRTSKNLKPSQIYILDLVNQILEKRETSNKNVW